MPLAGWGVDAFDAMIIRELGMDPFLSWPRRHAGQRFTDIARKIGRNLQFVKDRVQRMEDDGVITGYRVFPNLHHCSMDFTTFLWPVDFIPEKDQLSRLGTVDGFVGVFWSFDSKLCVDLTHASQAQLRRRMELIGELLDLDGAPAVLFDRAFPDVPRRLSQLDWRIIRAMEPDARRPLTDVAKELGVTAKTVRSRYNTMWEEGSIDLYATLDFERMSGVIPFGIFLWYEDGTSGTMDRLLDRFSDRYLDHVPSPESGYCSCQLRIFAYTPAEVQALVREVTQVEGVRDAEAFLVTGAYYNERWLDELLERQAEAETPAVPKSGRA